MSNVVRATALLVTILLLVGCGSSDRKVQQATDPTSTQTGTPQTSGGIPALVKRVGPSVVAILVGTGEGSGVVWDEEGHVVTNHHVIDGASDVEIQTIDGKRLPARVIASDPRTDLGVLKLERGDLPQASFAEGLPEVGSLAVAIGSPLGFENTVTAGIVSGLDRALPTGGAEPSLVGLLQTDAAISPGNSGGALVGATGDVIGINVAYLPPQQTGAVSIGFAIPAPTVRNVVEQLLEDGQVDHPFLGVQLAPVVIDDEPAVMVGALEQGGPADDAGMQPRDLIQRLDGQEISIIEDVYKVLREHQPGDTLKVTVERAGRELELELELGQLPTPAEGLLPGDGG
jgi:serine protease DegQ